MNKQPVDFIPATVPTNDQSTWYHRLENTYTQHSNGLKVIKQVVMETTENTGGIQTETPLIYPSTKSKMAKVD